MPSYTFGTSSGSNTYWAQGYVPTSSELTIDSSRFNDLLRGQMEKASREMAQRLERQLFGPTDATKIIRDTYQKQIEENLFRENTLLKHLKESTMSESTAAVAEARAERKQEQAKQLLAHIEAEIGQFEIVPGVLITARVEFPDNDKVYRYAWIRGDKRWYRTYSTNTYSTADVIDELVRLTLDADVVEWEIVGREGDGAN